MIGKKALFSFMILLVLTACAVVLSAGIGERFISPGAVAKTFLGMGDPGDDLIIMSFRMPRILVALFAGICLAAAGSILQGLIRNPLASPDIIGVTGGASVAVVLFLMLFSDKNNALTVSISWLPVEFGAPITFLNVEKSQYDKAVESNHITKAAYYRISIPDLIDESCY